MDTYDFNQSSEDYDRIARAINYIEANAVHQPDLTEIASSLNLSEYHFQRLFTRWAGISPKRFLQFLTKENAKELLVRSNNILDAAYEAGLSSPGRLHDLLIQTEAVTPGEFKSRGKGIHINYGFHPSPFGDCLLALTSRGICWLSFVDEDRPTALASLVKEWSNAELYESPLQTSVVIRQVFSQSPPTPLALHLRGTNFQIKVWEALLRLPAGAVTNYEALSLHLFGKNAARSVGSAVGHNPVAFIIPCHRVLRKSGNFGEYRYGSARKKAILVWENCRINVSE
jgi:AraC family transcriptional regulator, regulatory protein of adaptative response / methylated-DNA-[protein]-cysteine methyltransferase